MKVKDAIEQRKSIRKYSDKQIPEEIIKELLIAAQKAPSAKNVQSHKYFIVKNKDVIEKLKKEKAFEQPYVYDAPLIVVCCANPQLYPKMESADSSSDEYALIDLSIAASFMVLRAVELGLGSVFVAWVYPDKIRKVLGIPEEYIIPFVLPIGYPAENPNQRPRKGLDEITF
ncbi:MAG: nitroreductase family protein [Nanoarchaeota archaeon]